MKRRTIVVSHTGPLHYLVLIGDIVLLPQLFETVFVPEAVRAELNHARTDGDPGLARNTPDLAGIFAGTPDENNMAA
jgi:predicted nucleic acid-binding protein